MFFAISRNIRPDGPGTVLSFRMICLLTVFLTAAAGCASAPLYRTHPELVQRKSAIKTIGLLPPMVFMYEEQARFKLVPHDEWSREARETVRKAFLDETAAVRMPLKLINGEDRELNDMADLFSAVDFTIRRHVYLRGFGSVGDELFPEKAPSFDYSLGPAREMMERHRVDAVWIVTGYNLLPTTGAQLGDAGTVLLSILSGLGGAPVPALVLIKVELRAALVDKEGTILFYCKLNEEDAPPVGRNPGQFDIAQDAASRAAEEGPLEKDIRNPKVARHYIRALLSEYRKAVAQ